MGLIPGWRIKIPHDAQCDQKKEGGYLEDDGDILELEYSSEVTGIIIYQN